MRRLLFTLTTVLFCVVVFAQAPRQMSYQAVIRDSNKKLVANQTVGVQISILKDNDAGTAVYVETQKPTTNSNGLVSFGIGKGNVKSGVFSEIDWANGPYFIKTETDPSGGTNYTITGISQMLSVPYALYAEKGGTPGLQGLKGDKGDQGIQGEKGLAGAKGDKGDKGDTGLTGATGAKGDQGDQGIQGETGLTGAKGDKGDKGDQGIQGGTGLAGAKGDKGDTGLTGATGVKGDQGDQGIQGETGLAGSKGDKGDKGDTGLTGATGAKGDQGIQGETGLPGVKGDKGDKGDTGLTGATGVKGDKGDQGIQGGTGLAGAKGDKGDKGDTGLTGATGADGLTTSVNGVTQVGGAVTLAKADIGLTNVDNTADADKPVSTATKTALDNKVDKVTGKDLVSNGTATGDMLYWNGTAWVTVAAGTTGQLLSVNASGVPQWQNPSSLKSAYTNIPTTDASGVVFNGVVNANGLSTTVAFEYGTDTSYGTTVTATQNPVSGTINTAVTSTLITGLTLGSVYHVRIVIQNIFGTFYGNDFTFTNLYYGVSYAGGLVFTFDNAGHGVVCASTDQSISYNTQWSWYYAVDVVANLVLNGYYDWHLPSIYELDLIYRNLKLNNISDFNIYGLYWSSTQINTEFAMSLSFSNGEHDRSLIDHYAQVRAVRDF